MTRITDDLGLSWSGATDDGLAAFRQACGEFLLYRDDPVASVDRALAASPAMPMAHALKAWLHLLGTEPAGLPVARACLQAAARLPADDRERRHLAAIAAVADGRWRRAGRILEDLGAEHPRDLLALQAGHLVDFLVGDARMLRDRIARALPAWHEDLPGWHGVLGMRAFGLEECGDYAEAERCGRACVEREPRDGWGWHAVAHVMEMQDRAEEGAAWLGEHATAWSERSFFAVHNWWHLALFRLERGGWEEVLRLFDARIAGGGMPQALDLIDASAMLWRLTLLGVDVGARWEPVADRWAALGGIGQYAFNDWHAMMAYVGSERGAAQEAVLEGLRLAAAGDDDRAAFAREVGLDAARAIQACGQGRWRDALDLLRPLRSGAHRFGGSHAQRDLIDLTMIEAALRAGTGTLAAALVAERAARRPRCALTALFRRRAGPPQMAAA